MHQLDFLCAGEAKVDATNATIHLSSIFKWYSADFGGNAGVIDFLQKYLPPHQAADLVRVLKTTSKDKVKLKYTPYDWSTNSS